MAFYSIDILKLYNGYAKGFEDDYKTIYNTNTEGVFDISLSKKLLTSSEKWNNWLNSCLLSENINELIKTRKALQLGITEAEKKKLTTPAIDIAFLRWCTSIEKTIKTIIRKRHPLPPATDDNHKQYYKQKQLREIELEKYLRKESY